jgi:hypothetical protein
VNKGAIWQKIEITALVFPCSIFLDFRTGDASEVGPERGHSQLGAPATPRERVMASISITVEAVL